MSDKKDGGSAFGQVVELRAVRVEMDGSTDYEPEAMLHGGLTVRDYFAAKAMHALIVDAADEACSASDDETVRQERNEFAYDVATDAYRYADAMLRARDA